MFCASYREAGIVDDGRAIVNAQQISRSVQQPGLAAVQVQHELRPRKCTRPETLNVTTTDYAVTVLLVLIYD